MATSPSFNWPEPDNTDLVKNGALAIRTAVDAIDTSMTDLLGGTTGQVLSKTSATDMDFSWVTPATGSSGLTLITRNTFSNVASVTVDSVFSSSYRNYVLVIENTTASTPANQLQIQMRYGATTLTSTYYGQVAISAYNVGTISTFGSNNASQMTLTNAANSAYVTLNVGNVGNSSQKAIFHGTGFDVQGTQGYWIGGQTDTTQTYTGFLLKSSSSNITGVVSVYGLAIA